MLSYKCWKGNSVPSCENWWMFWNMCTHWQFLGKCLYSCYSRGSLLIRPFKSEVMYEKAGEHKFIRFQSSAYIQQKITLMLRIFKNQTNIPQEIVSQSYKFHVQANQRNVRKVAFQCELFCYKVEDCFCPTHLIIISTLLICVEYYVSVTETEHSPSIKCAPYLFSEVSIS
jgi:hypothetical protein